jgi:uncharacterized membrane protein YfcA
MDGNIIIISTIAIICGVFAGIIGSPGFALIVPLLMMSNIFESFKMAISVYYIGVVLPDLVNAIVHTFHNYEHVNLNINILFSIVFAIASGLSVYFSKYINDRYKFYIAAILQIFIGIWYIYHAKNIL